MEAAAVQESKIQFEEAMTLNANATLLLSPLDPQVMTAVAESPQGNGEAHPDLGKLIGALNYLADYAMGPDGIDSLLTGTHKEAAELAKRLSSEQELNASLVAKNMELENKNKFLEDKGKALSEHYLELVETMDYREYVLFTSGREAGADLTDPEGGEDGLVQARIPIKM